MWCESSSPKITNCTLSRNRGFDSGGELGCRYSSLPTIINSILWNNRGGIHLLGGASVIITYSNVQGGWQGEGNIDIDPQFVDPGRWYGGILVKEGDYYLKSQAGRYDPKTQQWIQDDVTSPCIDAGNPSAPIGYELFPNGGIINMGAYGGTQEASKSYFGYLCTKPVAGDINGDCIVNLKDFVIMASHWLEDHRK